MKKRLLIICDAYGETQTNGVKHTLENTTKQFNLDEWELKIIHPDLFKTFPLPGYSEIHIPKTSKKEIGKIISDFKPDYIHIDTEGLLGLYAKLWCDKNKLNYTTCYHTKFPEYVATRIPFIPAALVHVALKWFHKNSKGIMVALDSLSYELMEKGYGESSRFKPWTRGVDYDLFDPSRKRHYDFWPYMLYVGRVSHEKNIEAFLESKALPLLSRVVVGSGPQLESLKKKYPDVIFLGKKKGVELAELYASADVFVFPSKTDTFGLVIIEALASGVSVAAYDVTGPKDIITNTTLGYVSDDLDWAIWKAFHYGNSSAARSHAMENYTWEKAARQFQSNLVKV